MNQKHRRINKIKQALFLNCISLLLCGFMLVGTTYAWLTESVSTKTKITSGNLAVKLYRYNEESEKYIPISEEENIFTDGQLDKWEPGQTQIIYLAVKNEGTLAANCNTYLNVQDEGLARAVQYVIVDGLVPENNTATTWEDYLTDKTAIPLSVAAHSTPDINQKLATNLSVIPKDEYHYFALVLHMQEVLADNYIKKAVNISLSLTAGQITSEKDSFGNNYTQKTSVSDWNICVVKDELNSNLTATNEQNSFKTMLKNIIGKDPADVVTSITFGKWSQYGNKTDKDKFTEGHSLKSNEKVKVFVGKDRATDLYILINDDGTIKINKGLMRRWVRGWTALESVDFSGLDTSAVTSMESMFEGCTSLTSVKFGEYFSTGNVSNMANMFKGCTNLKSIDISSFCVWSVTRMNSMFQDCTQLTSVDMSSFETMSLSFIDSMFDGCSALTDVKLGDRFDTSNIASMSKLFCNCTSLQKIDLSGFGGNLLTNMQQIFFGCTNLTDINLTNVTTTNVTQMNGMFSDCNNLKTVDISSFDTNNVVNIANMFKDCKSITTIYASNKFVTTNIVDAKVFEGCSMLKAAFINNNIIEYIQWNQDNISAAMAKVCESHESKGYFTDISLKSVSI